MLTMLLAQDWMWGCWVHLTHVTLRPYSVRAPAVPLRHPTLWLGQVSLARH